MTDNNPIENKSETTIESLSARIDELETLLKAFMLDAKARHYPRLNEYINGHYWMYCSKCKTYDMVSGDLRIAKLLAIDAI